MRILKKKNNGIRISLFFFLLSTIFIAVSTSSLAASTNYEIALNKGTATFMVSQYNERKWEETIDKELEPDDFFGGDSDQIGAKSKITIRNVNNYKWDLYDALLFIFDIESFITDDLPNSNETLLFLTFLSEDYVEEIYSDKYAVWEAITVKWDFEAESFEESPDEPNNLMPIFKNPKDYDDLLEDYNNWALTINSTMVLLGLEPFPILDGDDFIWALIKNGLFAIARPFNAYLTDLVESLDCKDTIVKENSLIIEQEGVADYIIEVSFNDQGLMFSIVIKNDDNRVLYEITPDSSTTVILISLGGIAIILAGIIIVLLKWKAKNKR